MFIEAARAVADQVPSALLNQGLLYPLQSNILETEIQTAARVAKLVFDSGLARVDRPPDMLSFIREHVYTPGYKEQTRSNAASRTDRKVAEKATARR
jgi:malate dehydrogenase (oxaloacetate-decarboxylating)(NADP+)